METIAPFKTVSKYSQVNSLKDCCHYIWSFLPDYHKEYVVDYKNLAAMTFTIYPTNYIIIETNYKTVDNFGCNYKIELLDLFSICRDLFASSYVSRFDTTQPYLQVLGVCAMIAQYDKGYVYEHYF
jgi:hypothetical protein